MSFTGGVDIELLTYFFQILTFKRTHDSKVRSDT